MFPALKPGIVLPTAPGMLGTFDRGGRAPSVNCLVVAATRDNWVSACGRSLTDKERHAPHILELGGILSLVWRWIASRKQP